MHKEADTHPMQFLMFFEMVVPVGAPFRCFSTLCLYSDIVTSTALAADMHIVVPLSHMSLTVPLFLLYHREILRPQSRREVRGSWNTHKDNHL